VGDFRWHIGLARNAEHDLYVKTKTGERAVESCVFYYKVNIVETVAPIQSAGRYRNADEMLLDQITNVADLGDVTLKMDSFGQFGPDERKNPGAWGRGC
jgi:hypothetical protein